MRRGRWWISGPPLGRENSQGEERTMYRERAKGWLKHVDFMLLDVLSLELSFVLAYWIRMRSAHAYARSPYRNMGLALLLIDVVVIFFSSAYSFLRPSALPLTKNTTQAVGGIRSTYSAI